jgi:hypothetical protein
MLPVTMKSIGFAATAGPASSFIQSRSSSTPGLLLKELANTRREVRNLTVMGMRPDISADQREVIRQLERSARAQVKLGLRALNRGKPDVCDSPKVGG